MRIQNPFDQSPKATREQQRGSEQDTKAEQAKATAAERANQAAARARMGSGDVLAELGADKEAIDYIRANPSQYSLYIRNVIGDKYVSVGDDGVQVKQGQPSDEYSEGNTSPAKDYSGGPSSISPEYNMPTIYSGKKTTTDITTGIDQQVDTPKNLFEVDLYNTPLESTNAKDLTKLKAQSNLQTFDTLDKGGSFNINTITDRPFGQADPTTAFLQPGVVPLSDVSKYSKGNSIFRWA